MTKRSMLTDVSEPEAVKFYRSWSTAREEAKSSSSSLGEIVKDATETLDVTPAAWRFACNLRRKDPVKAQADWRDLKRLVAELGIEAQTDLLDQLEQQQPAA